MVCHGEYLVSGALACLVGSCAGGAPASGAVILVDGTPWSSGAGARTAAIRLSSDGYVYNGDNGTFTTQYAWKVTGAVSDYEAYCTLNIGTISGTTGSWLNLGTTRDWSITDNTADGEDKISGITIQIRNASTLEVLTSAYFELTASRIS